MNDDFYILADLVDGVCTAEQYYSQFVTPLLKTCVLNRFRIDFLKKKYNNGVFSDIGITYWDGIVYNYLAKMSDNAVRNLHAEIKKRGDFYSIGGMIYVAKEAARQLVLE